MELTRTITGNSLNVVVMNVIITFVVLNHFQRNNVSNVLIPTVLVPTKTEMPFPKASLKKTYFSALTHSRYLGQRCSNSR